MKINKLRFSIFLIILLTIGLTCFGTINYVKNRHEIELSKVYETFVPCEHLPKLSLTADKDGYYPSNGMDNVKVKKVGKKDGLERKLISDDSEFNTDLILVNREHLAVDIKAADTYLNLIEIKDKPFGIMNSDIVLTNKLYENLVKMLDDERQGKKSQIIVTSGFREHARQVKIYDTRIKEYIAKGYSVKQAEEFTKNEVAIPGSSEHQSGLALDINTVLNEGGKDNFHNTKPGMFIHENCQNYGFVNRYPQSKEEITNIKFEPWHFRYVGTPHSYIIKKFDFCLEEYIAFLQQEKRISVAINESETYEIYFIPKNFSGTTQIILPKDKEYSINYDNCKGYIVTIKTY